MQRRGTKCEDAKRTGTTHTSTACKGMRHTKLLDVLAQEGCDGGVRGSLQMARSERLEPGHAQPCLQSAVFGDHSANAVVRTKLHSGALPFDGQRDARLDCLGGLNSRLAQLGAVATLEQLAPEEEETACAFEHLGGQLCRLHTDSHHSHKLRWL